MLLYRINFAKSITIIDDEPIYTLALIPNIIFGYSFTVGNVTSYTQNNSDVLFVIFNKELGHSTDKQMVMDAINALYFELHCKAAQWDTFVTCYFVRDSYTSTMIKRMA
jgi:hypothetical protein